jgi:hypothetical protein
MLIISAFLNFRNTLLNFRNAVKTRAFHECISSLNNNKSPGPDGVVYKVPILLPSEMQRVINVMFIIMWATGLTPQGGYKD